MPKVVGLVAGGFKKIRLTRGLYLSGYAVKSKVISLYLLC